MRSKIEARWAIPMIALGVLLALILHSYSRGFLSVTADEFAKTVHARLGLRQPLFWFQGIWLPLHLMLIAATSLVMGDFFLASRLVSIVCGAVLVLALWGIGRQLGGNLGGGLAAVLGASHPLVVLLSATAMADICYVSMYMLGLSFYLKFSQSPRSNPTDLLAACGLLTLACAFHYNAWIAVVLLVPFLLRDLYRSSLSPLIVAISVVLLGSIPLGWVAWNWVRTGHPLAFFTNHSEYSASFWAHQGWFPSPRAAVIAIGHSLRSYSPLIAVLAFCGLATVFRGRSVERKQFLLWSLLLGFLAALVFLYARGGRPAAFEPRYVLLPSVLMISILCGSLATLWQTDRRHVRAFISLLTTAVVVVNIMLYREALSSAIHTDNHAIMAEARDVAKVMHRLKAREAPRMMLEIKYWNFLAMPVFLGRIDAIETDRQLMFDDPIRTFDNPSLLLGPREPVVKWLKTMGVGFIAVWSPAVQAHIEPWGFERLAKVDSYTIYRLPKDR